MTRPGHAATASLAVALAAALAPARARAQEAEPAPSTPLAGAEAFQPVVGSRVPERVAGMVRAGVYRLPREGAVPVRFELRSGDDDLVGVGPRARAFADRFEPGCATPCTMWFDPGRYVVQLGQSSLRPRTLTLDVDNTPLRVRFSRDQPAGVGVGFALAGLGMVVMLLAVPLALTEPGTAVLWWSIAGGGLAVLGGGAWITAAFLGGADVRAMPPPPPPPVGAPF
jgi:hypothetical protein